MIEIVIATRNKNKIREIKHALKDVPLKIVQLRKFPKIIETGKTLEANAVKKAAIVQKFTNKLTLAEDSGLFVTALAGKPGVKSARFAGEDASSLENNTKLLKVMNGQDNRTAFFKSCFAITNGRKTKLIKGICQGIITEESKGKRGFGYDPVFIPKGYVKTFGQMSLLIKNRISHRALALKRLKSILLSFSTNCRKK